MYLVLNQIAEDVNIPLTLNDVCLKNFESFMKCWQVVEKYRKIPTFRPVKDNEK